MKAKKKNGLPKLTSRCLSASAGKNVKRTILLRQSKSNSSSPENAVASYPRQATLKSRVSHQRRCTSSSSSLCSTSSTRRKAFKSNSSTPESISASRSESRGVKYSSRRSRISLPVFSKSSTEKCTIISSSTLDADTHPSNARLSGKSLLPGVTVPALAVAPLPRPISVEPVQISSDSSSSFTAYSDNKTFQNEKVHEGRRTSSRQRKPSWRVNFNPTELLEDKQASKANTSSVSPVPASKLPNVVTSPTQKSSSKKRKLEVSSQEDSMTNHILSCSVSGVVSENSQNASVMVSKQCPEPLTPKSESTKRKKSQAIFNTSGDSESSVNSFSDINLHTNIDIELNDDVSKLTAIKTDRKYVDPEAIQESQNGIQAMLQNTDNISQNGPVFDDCCCTETNVSADELHMSKESAELIANDCLQDEDDSHLLFDFFCQAVDLVGSDKIGCYRVVPNDFVLYRVSPRCPFRLLCSHHNGRLKLHQCCPICGYFCTHGPGIMLCTGNADCMKNSTSENLRLEPNWTSHLFHKTCAIDEVGKLASVSESSYQLNRQEQPLTSLENKIELISKIVCPHCGEGGDIKEISLTLKASFPVSVPERSLATRKVSVATVQNSANIPSPEDNILRYVEDSTAYALSKANKKAKLLLVEAAIPPLDAKTFLRYLLKEDLARIMATIESKHLVNLRFKSHGGQSPLHLAVHSRNISLVHGLIVSGANPNALDDNYTTPLMLAAKLNEPTLAKYLIAAGAEKYHKNPDGMNVVHISAAAGNLLVLQGILEDHADLLKTVDSSGMTCLMHAAKNSRTEIVNYFATFWPNEINLRAVDEDKNTSLHWAAASGAVQAVSSLIKNGAVVNARNKLGQTPLHLAVSYGRDGCVLTLLVNQADISLTDFKGRTPLDLCTVVSIEDGAAEYKPIDDGENLNRDSSSSIKRTIKQCLIQTSTLRSQISSSHDVQPYRIVSMDVSRGKEPHSTIQCINTLDNVDLAKNFKYITSSIFCCTLLQPPLTSVAETHCCNCCPVIFDNISLEPSPAAESSCTDLMLPTCLSNVCSCSVNTYDAKHRLFSHQTDQSRHSPLPFIQECNQLCGCDARLCCNRVVQRGSKCELQVFRTKRKEWGVKTLCRIPRGAFVCTYEGEIIDSAQASSRVAKYGDSYFFDLHGGHILIDSTEFGNVARFINHSCSPNIIPIKVLIEHQDKRFAHIAFFAKIDIDANVELAFDYGSKFWDSKLKLGLHCECQAQECRYKKSAEVILDSDDDVCSSDYDDVDSEGSNDIEDLPDVLVQH